MQVSSTERWPPEGAFLIFCLNHHDFNLSRRRSACHAPPWPRGDPLWTLSSVDDCVSYSMAKSCQELDSTSVVFDTVLVCSKNIREKLLCCNRSCYVVIWLRCHFGMFSAMVRAMAYRERSVARSKLREGQTKGRSSRFLSPSVATEFPAPWRCRRHRCRLRCVGCQNTFNGRAHLPSLQSPADA